METYCTCGHDCRECPNYDALRAADALADAVAGLIDFDDERAAWDALAAYRKARKQQ